MCRDYYSANLSLGGGEALCLALYRGVWTSWISTQQRLAVHFCLEAGDVAAAEVLAQVTHLLQLQEVDTQDLNGFYHLKDRDAQQ